VIHCLRTFQRKFLCFLVSILSYLFSGFHHQQHSKLLYSMSDIMGFFLAGGDWPQTNQPNDQASGWPLTPTCYFQCYDRTMKMPHPGDAPLMSLDAMRGGLIRPTEANETKGRNDCHTSIQHGQHSQVSCLRLSSSRLGKAGCSRDAVPAPSLLLLQPPPSAKLLACNANQSLGKATSSSKLLPC